jgi:putative cell wall-binding protein
MMNRARKHKKGRNLLAVMLAMTMVCSMVMVPSASGVSEGGTFTPFASGERELKIEIFVDVRADLTITRSELEITSEDPWRGGSIRVNEQNWMPSREDEDTGEPISQPFLLEDEGIWPEPNCEVRMDVLDAPGNREDWDRCIGLQARDPADTENDVLGTVIIDNSMNSEPYRYVFLLIFNPSEIPDKDLSVVVQDRDGTTFAEGYTVNWYRNDEEQSFATGDSITLSEDYYRNDYYFEVVLNEELSAIYRAPLRQRFEVLQTAETVYKLYEKNGEDFSLTVRANIDGKSELVLGSGEVYWHHISNAAPGRHDGKDEPTTLNGYEWFPWTETGTLHGERVSDPLSLADAINLDLYGSWELIGLEVSEALGTITVSQEPSAENDYEGKILFDDDAHTGDIWYTATLILRGANAVSTASLDVQDDAEASIPDGYTINWYAPDGDVPLATGTTIPYDENNSYEVEVVLEDESLGTTYTQPPRQAFVPGVGNRMILPLEKIASVTLSGQVKDGDGGAVADAEVVLEQHPNGRFLVEQRTSTDADGNYTLTALKTDTILTISKSEYISIILEDAITPDSPAAVDLGVKTLSPLSNKKILLAFSGREAAISGEEGALYDLASLSNLEFSLRNITQDRELASVTVQYPWLLLRGEALNPGDVIEISARDRSGNMTAAPVSATLDDELNATAQISFVDNGHFTASATSGASAGSGAGVGGASADSADSADEGVGEGADKGAGGTGGAKATRAMIFDASGNFVATTTFYGTMRSRSLPAGTYVVVFMEKTELLTSVSRVDKLAELGMTADEDFVVRNVSIENGRITELGAVTIPQFDAEQFQYTTIAELTVNKQTLSLGAGFVTYRLEYTLDDSYPSSGETVTVEFPEGVEFKENAAKTTVTLDGAPVLYTYTDRTLSVATNKRSGVLRFCGVPDEAGEQIVAAFLRFDTGAGTAIQPLGQAAITATPMLIDLPSKTALDEVNISGFASVGSEVAIYDNGTQTAVATANSNGRWLVRAPLDRPYAWSTHLIHAVSTNKEGVTVRSEEKTLEYNNTFADVAKVTMINTGSANQECRTVIDYAEPNDKALVYSYNPAFPTFTFLVELVNPEAAAGNVTVVVKGANGETTRVPTTYMPDKGLWAGTMDFRTENRPQGISVTFSDNPEVVTMQLSTFQESESQTELKRLLSVLEADRQLSSFSGIEATVIKNSVSSGGFGDVVLRFSTSAGTFYYRVEKETVTDGLISLLPGQGYAVLTYQNGDETFIKSEISANSLVNHRVKKYDKVSVKVTWSTTDPTKSNTPPSPTSLRAALRGFVGEFSVGLDRFIATSARKGDPDPGLTRISELLGRWAGEEVVGSDALSKLNKEDTYRRYVPFLDEVKALQVTLDGKQNLDIAVRKTQKNLERLEACHCIGEQTRIDELWAQLDNFSRRYPDVLDESVTYNVSSIAATLFSVVAIRDSYIPPGYPENIMHTQDLLGAAPPAELTISVNQNKILKDELGLLDDEIDKLEDRCTCGMVMFWYSDCGCGGMQDEGNFIGGGGGGGGTGDSGSSGGGGNTDNRTGERPVNGPQDPSGYVYEAVPSNRLSGVTATLYLKYLGEDEWGDLIEVIEQWDAGDYNQENPLITDVAGVYAWDVPDGLWQVKYEKDGYETALSDWMEVPPPQLDVNVGLVSNAAPTVSRVDAFTDGIDIGFDKYLKTKPSALDTPVIVHVTQAGKALAGTIEFINAESDSDGNVFATGIRFVPDAGTTLEVGAQITVSVSNVKSYAGVAMENAYDASATVQTRLTSITAEDISLVYGTDGTLSISAKPQEAAANKHLLVKSNMPSIASVTGASVVQIREDGTAEVALGADGTTEVTVEANLPGKALFTLSVEGSDLQKEVAVDVILNQLEQSRIEITGLAGSYTYGDEPIQLGVEGGNGNGAVIYTSDNEAVAKITGDDLDTLTIVGTGSFSVTAVKQGDDVYREATATSGPFTVSPKPITVTAEDKDKYAGSADPLLTWVVSPDLRLGDMLVGSLKLVKTETDAYEIVEDIPFSHPHYTITFVKGNLTIREAPTENEEEDIVPPPAPVITQHEGLGRQDTAARASAKAYPDPSQVNNVILAYSYDFPDALAASYLAGVLDAPILLCDTNEIPTATASELSRLRPSAIYIVGGTGVISDGVKATLEAYDFTSSVTRLGGAGREETAYLIATEAKNRGGVPTSAFVVNAADFPDALSAGSLSAWQGVPILLTATGSLDGWASQFLAENSVSDIIIVGGPGSVSEGVAGQLQALSFGPAVTRWSGSDRYATSQAVLDSAIAKWNLKPTVIGLASGEDFPDALVGGAAVGNRGGLLAITGPDTLSPGAAAAITTHKGTTLTDVEIFGGTGTIRVASAVQNLLA